MAMQPPQGPSDMFRTATMASAVVMSRDKQNAIDELDERERDRVVQERFEQEQEAQLKKRKKRFWLF